jgi:hypothetical protein
MNWTPPEIIVPILMYCAMLWWIGRRFSWTQRLTVGVVTLSLVLFIILFERGGF